MAREVRTFPVTIPAGTAITSPQVTAMTMPARVVEALEIQVPPGPRGEVGFRIGAAGVQLLPFQLGQWLVCENEIIRWALEGFHDSGSWEFTGYNTGLYPHTITTRFLLNLPGRQVAAGGVPITADQLGAVPGGPSLGELPIPGALPLPDLPQLPELPVILPPIAPMLELPGQQSEQRAFTRRAQRDLVADYGGGLHVFHVTPDGRLHHELAPSASGHGSGAGWEDQTMDWAVKLAPAAMISGALFGGQAHVFVPMQAGGVLHLAQPDSGGPANSWGGEVLGEK